MQFVEVLQFVFEQCFDVGQVEVEGGVYGCFYRLWWVWLSIWVRVLIGKFIGVVKLLFWQLKILLLVCLVFRLISSMLRVGMIFLCQMNRYRCLVSWQQWQWLVLVSFCLVLCRYCQVQKVGLRQMCLQVLLVLQMQWLCRLINLLLGMCGQVLGCYGWLRLLCRNLVFMLVSFWLVRVWVNRFCLQVVWLGRWLSIVVNVWLLKFSIRLIEIGWLFFCLRKFIR